MFKLISNWFVEAEIKSNDENAKLISKESQNTSKNQLNLKNIQCLRKLTKLTTLALDFTHHFATSFVEPQVHLVLHDNLDLPSTLKSSKYQQTHINETIKKYKSKKYNRLQKQPTQHQIKRKERNIQKKSRQLEIRKNRKQKNLC